MSTLQNTNYSINNTDNNTLNKDNTLNTNNEFINKKSSTTNLESNIGKPEYEHDIYTTKPTPISSTTTSNITTGGSSIANTDNTTTTATNYGSTTTTAGANPSQSKSEHLKQKVSNIGHSIGDSFTNASLHLNEKLTGKPQTQSTTTTTHTAPTTATGSDLNTGATTTSSGVIHQQHASKGGFGAKLSDMMSHVGAALHHGHPVHAVTNASTAAKVGECERIKHERGPIADSGEANPTTLDNPNFNSAGQPYENISTSATATYPQTTATASTYPQTTGSSFNQSTAYSTNDPSLHHYTTSEKVHDMASHAKAQLSHGNPVTAISDAPAAARIGEAEKMKHQKGPIGENPESDKAGLVSNQSNLGSSNLGGSI